MIPNHQFGFRGSHSTVEQIHRVIEIVEDTLEERKVCSSVFLDVSQAFDKVWYEGLLYKLGWMLPEQYCGLLKSYLSDKIFHVKHSSEYSNFKEVSAGLPQGSVLSPTLYLLYTSNILQDETTTVVTFADVIAILAIGDNLAEAKKKLQQSVNKIDAWTKK